MALHKHIEVRVPSPSGGLEAIIELPPVMVHRAVAVICHPHPLHGGTMNSKVVYTAAHAFLDLGIPSLRFNFRGVGKSSGIYDNGTGEQDDVRAALDHMEQLYPNTGIMIAGHSFGAFVGMKAGCLDPRVRLLMGIGMPVGFFDMGFLFSCTKPKLFIHGTHDKLISTDELDQLFTALPKPKDIINIEGADHLFSSRLHELSGAVKRFLDSYLPTEKL